MKKLFAFMIAAAVVVSAQASFAASCSAGDDTPRGGLINPGSSATQSTVRTNTSTR